MTEIVQYIKNFDQSYSKSVIFRFELSEVRDIVRDRVCTVCIQKMLDVIVIEFCAKFKIVIVYYRVPFKITKLMVISGEPKMKLNIY